MSEPSQWVASGAAVVAACVVAWQSLETRRSANASEKAVRAASEALELTREQAAEAVRARIDEAMPRIAVTAPDEPEWPPLEPSGSIGGEPQPLTFGLDGSPMHMPRDKARMITVRVEVLVINDSDAHVVVNCPGLVDQKLSPLGAVRLEPNGVLRGAWFAVTHSLEDWITVYRARQSGTPLRPTSGRVYYLDPADTGATDSWEIAIDGCPIEPVEDREGMWRIIGAPLPLSGRLGAMGVGPILRERLYYLSKSRNQPLPEPEVWTEAAPERRRRSWRRFSRARA